jgi:hypothetical protein
MRAPSLRQGLAALSLARQLAGGNQELSFLSHMPPPAGMPAKLPNPAGVSRDNKGRELFFQILFVRK